MPKQLAQTDQRDDEFPISPYRIDGLLISDMLNASLPEPSLLSWFPLSSQDIRHRNNVFYLIPPPPVLLCQMTNTPYQGSELADVSNCEQGSKLISSLIFAGIFNRHAIPNQDNRYGHFSSPTTSLSFGSP